MVLLRLLGNGQILLRYQGVFVSMFLACDVTPAKSCAFFFVSIDYQWHIKIQ
jgi:hypothetical protein